MESARAARAHFCVTRKPRRQFAKPADLPAEHPMKVELVVNLKTAKQIGVNIDPNLLVRATRIVK
jgi:ABC-type uncharacterized transport system substrate-binding protein